MDRGLDLKQAAQQRICNKNNAQQMEAVVGVQQAAMGASRCKFSGPQDNQATHQPSQGRKLSHYTDQNRLNRACSILNKTLMLEFQSLTCQYYHVRKIASHVIEYCSQFKETCCKLVNLQTDVVNIKSLIKTLLRELKLAK